MRTVAKSLDSRTMVENEVRSRAAADSSAMEISRLQRISNVTGSKFAFAGFVMGPLFSCRVSGGRGVPLSLQKRIEFAKVELQMLFLYVVTFIFIAERDSSQRHMSRLQLVVSLIDRNLGPPGRWATSYDAA
jgi:hypothetical protein